ncbi:MAG: YggS family pyridoxal phosphate-dependent enzyme [Aestuariivirga sp.]
MSTPHPGLDDVSGRLSQAARAAERNPASVTLIAVSKTFDADAIRPVIAAGQRDFGENRVQEAQGKWPELRRETPDVRLHLIGPLQSNKTRDAVALFDCIHSIDRPKIAKAVAEEMTRQKKPLQLFIQVNTGDESQKAGVSLKAADNFIRSCREEFGLSIAGLMCIPPVDADPVPHFQLLAEIAKRHGLSSLSMGMSGDFPEAIVCGATHVRVGSAIFGTRTGYP